MIKRLIEPVVVSSCVYNKMSQIKKVKTDMRFYFTLKAEVVMVLIICWKQ